MRVVCLLLAVLFAAMWVHDGLEGMYWHERAKDAERRAADAEAWAAAVEAEAEMWVEKMGR